MHTRMISAAISISLFSVTAVIAGCGKSSDNQKPMYGSETGLPANCRAYVQFAIDEFRSKKYTADETMSGLERNCGEHGSLWQ